MNLVRPLARSETGLALVILLVVVLAVTLVGLAMADNVIRETQIAVNQYTAIQARYLAEAGIADAAARLSQSNTWVGPITQSLGAGSYTVQVGTTVSNSALKTIVSTGTVFSGTPSGSGQTIRETVLVLPQAFSKAALSNTMITINNVSGANPTVQNTVLRQLGTVHANNVNAEVTSVLIQNPGTTTIGQVTASQGTVTIDPASTCIACNPQTNQPVIPFPLFNWQSYITLAQNNPSPCPGINPNTLFPSQATFDSCVASLPADALGFRTLTGTIFLNFSPLTLPNIPQESPLRVNGTLAVYTETQVGCSIATPCGDLIFSGGNLIFTAQTCEPAVMTGGVVGQTFNTAVAITGMFYILANTISPTVNLPVDPSYALAGSPGLPATITGLLIGQRLNLFSSNALSYDPSTFFSCLPSGLNPPAGPFVLLPVSWSSGR